METAQVPNYTDSKTREIMLKYFYSKNKFAKSRIGKSNSAAISISIIRRELKNLYSLKQEDVFSNLTYLISQGWIEEKHISKSFSTGNGTVIPSVTTYYVISADGIDKIDGPSEFTRDKYTGIKIEATGQNIITLGDGNKINSKFEEVGNSLNNLKEAIKKSSKLTEVEKVDAVVDIESIQEQLGKPYPNKSVLNTLWNGIARFASLDGIINLYEKANHFMQTLI